MGTNYYLHTPKCEHCGRGDAPVHIGRSSIGWCFALHIYPGQPSMPASLDEWKIIFGRPGNVIRDEYGEIIDPTGMASLIEDRKAGDVQLSPAWLADNDAVKGPRGLARSRIDGRHCIAHGGGTWDLIVGDFC
jgi:hypothetical protein